MGYNNRFVLCVLVGGTPQKELANGEVHIPFGSDYSLRLRNRHNRDAAVKIYIDGENVSGEGYKVPANDKIDIHRYADKDVSFKFVDLDSPEAVEHGKNGPNHDKTKGVIEARFYLEKEAPKPARVEHHYHSYPVSVPPYNPWDPWKHPFRTYSTCAADSYAGPQGPVGAQGCQGPVGISMGMTSSAFPGAASHQMRVTKGGPSGQSCDTAFSACCNYSAAPAMAANPTNLREGATVEGHWTGQTFRKVHMDLETDYVSIKLFLKGYDQSTLNETPVVVHAPSTTTESPAPFPPTLNNGKSKFCEVCGNHIANKMANFCGNCGNKLN